MIPAFSLVVASLFLVHLFTTAHSVCEVNPDIVTEKDATSFINDQIKESKYTQLVDTVEPGALGMTISVNIQTNTVDRQQQQYDPFYVELVNIDVPFEFATYLDLGYPWRIPHLSAYEISDGQPANRSADAPISIGLKDRLTANEVHNIIVLVKYFDYSLSFFIFLNGNLRGQFSMTTLMNHFENKELKYPFTSNFDGELLQSVSYWPRTLTYREIRHVARVARTSVLNQRNPSTKPTLSWITEGLLSSSTNPTTSTTSTCINSEGNICAPEATEPSPSPLLTNDTSLSILFFPSFYAEHLGAEIPPSYIASLLIDPLCSIVDTIPPTIPIPISNNQVNQPVDDENKEGLRSDDSNRDKKADTVSVSYEVIVFSKHKDLPTMTTILQPFIEKYTHFQFRLQSMDDYHPNFATSANLAVNSSVGDIIVFLSSDIVVSEHWLDPLVGALQRGVTIVGSKIINLQGQLLHCGFEYFELPYAGGLEVYLTPYDRYRGYWSSDARCMSLTIADAVSKRMMAISKSSYLQLGGLSAAMSPIVEDVDLCARALQRHLVVAVVGESVGQSLGPILFETSGRREEALASEIFNPQTMPAPFLDALKTFSSKWISFFADRRKKNYLTDARFTWVIHCGGSQGLEAATIMQSMVKLVDLRSIIRRYRECEHADTISEMPASFRDVLEYSTLRIFTEPFKGNVRYANGTSEFSPVDRAQDSSIVLYARDYRELGRWVPPDAALIVGRYMFEADGLPRAWVMHQNKLDEVWVPSQWQLEVFANAGVDRSKLVVQPETVDSCYFDPDIVQPLAMPGSVLDGFGREDPKRPFAICSVYKMEDRKGWKELIEAYVREFTASDNVVLLLRTYLHLMSAITKDAFDRTEIYAQMNKHLLSLPNMPPQNLWPPIDLVSDHLPSWQMPMFYKACDAFALSTHGEGWGLPTHEAMAMGLPVVTTNWGGSTEFVTAESGLLVELEGLVDTSETDPWIGGFKWANVSIADLRAKLRLVAGNRTLAKLIGTRGREYVLEHYSPEAVAKSYVNRLAYLQTEVIPRNPPDHGDVVTSKFDRHWDMPFHRFKDCAITSRSLHAHGQLATFTSKSGIRRTKPGIGGLCDYIILTTWKPRECGIATFSDSLRNALLESCPTDSRIHVIALRTDSQDPTKYDSSIVKFIINEYNGDDYIAAAQFVNENNYGTLLVQYEFGIMPGGHLMCLMHEVKSRIITTIHTVVKSYTEENQGYIQQVTLLSYKSIVMTHMMRHALTTFHAVPGRDIVVIPHGVPNVPFHRTEGTPEQYLYPGRIVIFSNGLLHQKKGIEYVIRAMPQIIQVYPEVLYVVQGKPHPTGWGAKDYYQHIIGYAKETAPDYVVFNETFVPTEELYEMLQSISVYVNAYIELDQAVSGTLAMAMGTGAAVVSTPYPYAIESLRNNTGILVPFMDSSAIAEAILTVIANKEAADIMRRKAYEFAQEQIWKKVAISYLELSSIHT